MLSFSALEMSDREEIDRFLQSDGVISSIRTFSSLYIWGEHYQTCISVDGDVLYMRSCTCDKKITYYMPLGGDIAQTAGVLRRDAGEQNKIFEIAFMTKDGADRLNEAFPGEFEIEEQRSEFEYVYKSEDMISLSGKKYHGKRNFINRFRMEYDGRWEYSPVDPKADYDEILEFVRQWCNGRDDAGSDDYRYEYSAINRALKYYDELDVRGGKITLDGKLIAFSLATPQNERVIDILIEKADNQIEGAYQMINNQFAMSECAAYQYINREEDMGIEGLRHAKLSYHPAFLTDVYKAVPVAKP